MAVVMDAQRVAEYVARARAAQQRYEGYSQRQVDEAVAADPLDPPSPVEAGLPPSRCFGGPP